MTEYGFNQIRDDLSHLKRATTRFGLYAMITLTMIGSSIIDSKVNDTQKQVEEIVQKQSELETICKSNGALHIKNVTGGAAEDVYLEADGKRWFLYVDGKAVTQQPLSGYFSPITE